MDKANAKEIRKIAKEMEARVRFYAENGVDVWKRAPASPAKNAPPAERAPSGVSEPIAPYLALKGAPGAPAGALTLERVREEIGDCKKCKLCATRNNIVFGTGNPHASLLFVGEAPGEDEDLQGKPFVGRAGQLLTKMIVAMGLSREEVYIANIIKCRPPKNRNPEPDEIASCQPFLLRQIQAIRPKVICALGTFSAQTLLQTQQKISALRGRFHDLPGTQEIEGLKEVKVLPTFHPAYLLRNPSEKKRVWEDLQTIMAELKGDAAEIGG